MESDVPMRQKQKAVTLKDIAQACGVSVMAVSLALRGRSAEVSKERMSTILNMARKLNYDVAMHSSARRLRYSSTEHVVPNQLVAVDFPMDFAYEPYWATLISAISTVLVEHDFSLLTGWTSKIKEGTVPAVFRRGEVDGLIHVPAGLNGNEVVRVLRENSDFGKRPVVSVFSQTADFPVSRVLADEFGGGCLLAEHLLRNGHREIFYQGNMDTYMHRERLRGMRETFAGAGFDPDKALHPFSLTWDIFDLSSFQEALEKWPNCRAVCAPNDSVALGLWNALEKMGYRVPEDYSVIGYDDTLPFQSNGKNRLTTIHVPLREAGTRSAEILLSRISGTLQEDQDVTFPVSIVFRESVTKYPERRMHQK